MPLTPYLLDKKNRIRGGDVYERERLRNLNFSLMKRGDRMKDGFEHEYDGKGIHRITFTVDGAWYRGEWALYQHPARFKHPTTGEGYVAFTGYMEGDEVIVPDTIYKLTSG